MSRRGLEASKGRIAGVSLTLPCGEGAGASHAVTLHGSLPNSLARMLIACVVNDSSEPREREMRGVEFLRDAAHATSVRMPSCTPSSRIARSHDLILRNSWRRPSRGPGPMLFKSIARTLKPWHYVRSRREFIVLSFLRMCDRNQGSPIIDSQLRVNVMQMDLHSAFWKVEPSTNAFVRKPTRHQS